MTSLPSYINLHVPYLQSEEAQAIRVQNISLLVDHSTDFDSLARLSAGIIFNYQLSF